MVSESPGRRPEATDDVLALEAAAADLRRVWEAALAGLGATLTPVQLRALLTIDRAGPLSLNDLARELCASSSAASKVCNRLRQAGLITRRTAPHDRRGVVLSISRTGARLIAWVRARHRERLAGVLAGMGADGRDRLVTGLRALHDTLAAGG